MTLEFVGDFLSIFLLKILNFYTDSCGPLFWTVVRIFQKNHFFIFFNIVTSYAATFVKL
jgi:hypothetical protein